MPTKFITRSSGCQIQSIEVTRETEQSVFVVGYKGQERRCAKSSSYENYHDSWEVAHQFLIDKAEADVEMARRRLAYAQSILGNAKGLKKPAA